MNTVPLNERLDELKRTVVRWPVQQQRSVALAIIAILAVIMISTALMSATSMTSSKDRWHSLSSELHWMEAQEENVNALSPDVTDTSDPRSLLSITRAKAREHSVAIERYQPIDDSGLRVGVNESEFKNVLQWLDALRTTPGVRIEQLTLTDRPTPGQVGVSLIVAKF